MKGLRKPSTNQATNSVAFFTPTINQLSEATLTAVAVGLWEKYSMENNNKHLVRVGHEFAAAMSDDTPIITIEKMVTELASALDVQTARSEALETQLNEMAAENAELKRANAVALNILNDEDTLITSLWASSVHKVVSDTPATDAFLAETRAQGVDSAIGTAKNVVAQEFQYKDFETAQLVCSKFPESDLVGKVEMVEWLEDFAAQLRGNSNGGAL